MIEQTFSGHSAGALTTARAKDNTQPEITE
jgi:hypothetical protein